MSDPLLGIVNDHCQLISKNPIGTAQHEIPNITVQSM